MSVSQVGVCACVYMCVFRIGRMEACWQFRKAKKAGRQAFGIRDQEQREKLCLIEIQRSIVDEWSVNERKGVREGEREREGGSRPESQEAVALKGEE